MSDALRAEICRVGASLHARGYVHASAGNISVRTDTGFLITATDACLGTLDPAQLAEVNAHGVQTGGERASKTLALHRAIYAAEPDARCVIHTHATHTVALTLAGVWSVDDADALVWRSLDANMFGSHSSFPANLAFGDSWRQKAPK